MTLEPFALPLTLTLSRVTWLSWVYTCDPGAVCPTTNPNPQPCDLVVMGVRDEREELVLGQRDGQGLVRELVGEMYGRCRGDAGEMWGR